MNMTKQQLFKMAHEAAKKLMAEGAQCYAVAFKLGLKMTYDYLRRLELDIDISTNENEDYQLIKSGFQKKVIYHQVLGYCRKNNLTYIPGFKVIQKACNTFTVKDKKTVIDYLINQYELFTLQDYFDNKTLKELLNII